MKDTLKSALEHTRRVTVDKERTIDFMGEEGRVYSTPQLVRDIEETCREFMLTHADPGEDSVGVSINVSHLAPTLLGMWVEFRVKVAEVDGRRVRFEVTGRDAVDEICRGEHQRFAVDIAKTVGRLKEKSAAAAALAP